MLANFSKKPLSFFLISILFIALCGGCYSKKEHLAPAIMLEEQSSFNVEKDGKSVAYTFIQATIYPGPSNITILEIFASGDMEGMIRLQIKFNGVGTYTLGGIDAINRAMYRDGQDNVTSQTGSVFIHSFTNGKISGVFNFTGPSSFSLRTITVNKGKFTSIPLQR